MSFSFFYMSFVFLSMKFYLYTQTKFQIEFIVVLISLVCLLLYIVNTFLKVTKKLIYNIQKSFLIIIGFVYGCTNIGVILLAVFTNSQYSYKKDILNYISLCYLSFGIVQTTIVLLFKPNILFPEILFVCLYAMFVYLALGIFRFANTSEYFNKYLFSGFVFIYALLLILIALF